MAFADSKEIAEYALRLVRLMQNLPHPRQMEVMAVAAALVQVEFNRWVQEQRRGPEDE